jgi:predicted Zn-dependent protease
MQIGSDKSLMQVDALKIAVEANPDEPMLRVVLAGALRAKGLLKAALETIDEVLVASPELPSAIVTKAQILRSKGHHSEAKELLSSLAEIYPTDGNIFHELAHLLADRVGAERAFERAADCQPTQVRHLECLAQQLIRTGSRRESKLKKAAVICGEIKRVGGSKSEAGADKLLEAIHARLERLANQARRNGRRPERPK